MFRPLTPKEYAVLSALLRAGFPGRDELVAQLTDLRALPIDADGSLQFSVKSGATAAVLRRIPVEAECLDSDGVMIHILLHVIDGEINEMEVYREDSRPVLREFQPADLKVIVW